MQAEAPQLSEELEPALMPGDTMKGRWKNEASSQPRASRFADPDVQHVNHQVEEELEPVLNVNDLLHGANEKRESKFRNQEQLEEEDDEEDGGRDGEGEEQGQEVSRRDLIYLNSERETQPDVFQMNVYDQPIGGFEEDRESQRSRTKKSQALNPSSNVFEPFAVPNQAQSRTPNDKPKHNEANAYS